MSDRTRSRRFFLLLGIVAAYLTLCLTYLRTPGIEYDEVLYAGAALGLKEGPYAAYEWNIGGLKLPLMLFTYIGAVRAWIYAIVFAVFGIGIWPVRLPMIGMGVVTLLCVERFVRPMFGARVAMLATLLLAVDPSFIFSTRQDYAIVGIMLATKTASLALLAHFFVTRRNVHLFLAFLLLGIGFFDKFNYAWHLGAASVAAVVVWPQLRPFLTAKNLAIAAVGFLAGCWPLLVYNIVTRGGTFAGVVPEPSLLDAARVKSWVILGTLDGRAFPSFALQEVPEPTFMPWALVLALVGAVIGRRRLALRWFGFCWVILVLISAAIVVTPKATGGHHAMMLWPFPQIVVAAAAIAFLDASRGWSSWRGAIGMLAPGTVMTLLVSSVTLDIRTLIAFHTTGGRGVWSDAIYDLARVISSDTTHHYVIGNWGMFNQILLLSGGKARQEEISFALMEPGGEDTQLSLLRPLISDPRNRFVFMTAEYAPFPHGRHVFDWALERLRCTASILQSFHQRDGHVVYEILQVTCGTAPSRAQRLLASTDRGWLRAERIQGACENGTAIFRLEWNAPAATRTEVHVLAPDGPLFSLAGSSGRETTGRWVTPGTTFYLQDATPSRATGAAATIAKLETDFVCP